MSASDVIARLRALRAKATAGRWESGALFDSDFRDILNAGGDNIAYGFASSGTGILRPQDSAAIVAAMNSLEPLLECAEALETVRGCGVLPISVGRIVDAALQALAEGGGE